MFKGVKQKQHSIKYNNTDNNSTDNNTNNSTGNNTNNSTDNNTIPKYRTLTKRESQLRPNHSESFQCPCPLKEGIKIFNKLPLEIRNRIDTILLNDPDIWYVDLIIPDELIDDNNKCKCDIGVDKESCRYTIRFFKNFKPKQYISKLHYIKNTVRNPRYMGYYTNKDIEYLQQCIGCSCCERHQQNRGVLEFSGKKGIYYIRSCYADGSCEDILDMKENRGFEINKNKTEEVMRKKSQQFKSKKIRSKKKGKTKISKRSGKKHTFSANNYEYYGNNEYNNNN